MIKKVCIIGFLVAMMIVPVCANTKEEVTLNKCVDGDTTHFERDGKDITVRYLAINAPEYTKEKEPFGKEASNFVCDLLTNAKKIELEYDDESDEHDKYGRVLAWVYADGALVQETLVKKGLAEVKYLYGDYAYTAQLQAAEKQAKQQKLAMWSDVVPDDTSIPTIASVGVGVVMIIIGVWFTKGKGNKQRMIKQGMKQIKKR